MNRVELKKHKTIDKNLPGSVIQFGQGFRLPKPLDKVVRSKTRTKTTKLLKVAPSHYVCFLWRDGQVRIKSAFYAWLLYQGSNQKYTALASLHYHPSHKPAHLVTRCRADPDEDLGTLGRGCSELNLKSDRCDPRIERDRLTLIELFCKATGIKIIQGTHNDAAASQSLDLRPL